MSEYTETVTYTKHVPVTNTIEVPKVGSRWKYKDDCDDTVRTITRVGAINTARPGSTKVYAEGDYEGELEYFIHVPGCGATLYEPAPEPKWYENMTREQLVDAMAKLEASYDGTAGDGLYYTYEHLVETYAWEVAV